MFPLCQVLGKLPQPEGISHARVYIHVRLGVNSKRWTSFGFETRA